MKNGVGYLTTPIGTFQVNLHQIYNVLEIKITGIEVAGGEYAAVNGCTLTLTFNQDLPRDIEERMRVPELTKLVEEDFLL